VKQENRISWLNPQAKQGINNFKEGRNISSEQFNLIGTLSQQSFTSTLPFRKKFTLI
jgi:hypothetical protein